MTAEEIFAGETDNVDFKVDIPPKSEKYMKTVVAFANGNGGKLIFGVENNTWRVVGFTKEDVFQKIDTITNAIFDSCEPKITPNVAIQELIMEGTNRSYDQMEREDVVSEEEIAVFCDKLYAHALELSSSDEMKAQIHKVSKDQLLSWKLLKEKAGVYHPTNGYLLLDGQSNDFSEATIQCAVFKGTVRDIFITRKEFAGSIYDQIDEAYNFVLQHINLGSRIEGVARQDYYELPVKTIRKIISNAVCHRSYLTPARFKSLSLMTVWRLRHQVC